MTNITTNPGTTGNNQTINLCATLAGGYYAVSYTLAVSNGGITFNSVNITGAAGVGAGPVWQHLCAPNFDLNIFSCESARILGESLMFTNEASPLNRQGQVTAVQLPPEALWSDYAAIGKANILQSSKSAVTLSADDGIRIWQKPTSEADFLFVADWRVENGVIVDIKCPLNLKSDFLAVMSQIVPTAGRDAKVLLETVFEYQTEDVFRDPRSPDTLPEEWELALRYSGTLQNITENADHLRNFADALKRYAKLTTDAIAEYGPSILMIGKAIASIL